MFRFRDFINESKWNKLLYHATRNDYDPKDIESGSHFGTLHAAMARAHDTSSPPHKNLKIHAYKYETPGKGLHTDSDLNANRFAHDKNKRKVREYAKNRGITHITYKNAEESPGSTSTIVYDPENLQHVKTFNAPDFIRRKRYYEGGKKNVNEGFGEGGDIPIGALSKPATKATKTGNAKSSALLGRSDFIGWHAESGGPKFNRRSEHGGFSFYSPYERK